MASPFELPPTSSNQYALPRYAYIIDINKLRAAKIQRELKLTQNEYFATYAHNVAHAAQNVAYETYLGNIAFSSELAQQASTVERVSMLEHVSV